MVFKNRYYWLIIIFKEADSLSIAESLKATAEAFLSKQVDESQPETETIPDQQQQMSTDTNAQSYIYDQSTGLYYHPATGYYWDPVRLRYLFS